MLGLQGNLAISKDTDNQICQSWKFKQKCGEKIEWCPVYVRKVYSSSEKKQSDLGDTAIVVEVYQMFS